MKLARSKKLTFFNNKGGVGKTTIAHNCAVQFALAGFKTVLLDFDPQCNLTRLALGERFYENTLWSSRTVKNVLDGVVKGGGDIDLSFQFETVKQGNGNLQLLRGSIELSDYENLLTVAYNQAAAGEQIGYFATSALSRFIEAKGREEQIDIFVVDTSPTMGLLNRVILLDADYFVVPVNPDAFSLQGIAHLGVNLEKWRNNWRDTGRALAKSNSIGSQFVLEGEPTFIGYVINAYNVYAEQPIKDHRKWIDQMPDSVKKFLSEKHSKNGLVARSCERPLQVIQDYGRIPALCHENGDAIFAIDPEKVASRHVGTKENVEKAKEEFNALASTLLATVTA